MMNEKQMLMDFLKFHYKENPFRRELTNERDVDAYLSSKNDGKPIVSGSLPLTQVQKVINGLCEIQAAGLWEAFKEENQIMLNELRMLISGNDR